MDPGAQVAQGRMGARRQDGGEEGGCGRAGRVGVGRWRGRLLGVPGAQVSRGTMGLEGGGLVGCRGPGRRGGVLQAAKVGGHQLLPPAEAEAGSA